MCARYDRAKYRIRRERPVSEGRVVGTNEGGIATLLFDNAARRNAISIAMSQQAAEILDAFGADPDVRLLIIAGAGDKSFISGADISEFEKNRKDPETAAHYSRISSRMYNLVREFPKPTVAKIRGFCFGGGVGLAAACDLRVAADDALFSIPAARLGIAYRPDFIAWLGEIVGPARVKEMLITARRYPAAEALALGLVHRVAPVADFEAFFADYVAAIADNAPLSTAAAKAVVNEVADQLRGADLDKCRRIAAACTASEDFKEGRRAFMEKRRPQFKGR
jgi:enoyl-CoA hydratase/carnithine racemase